MIEALQEDVKSQEYKQEIRDWDAIIADRYPTNNRLVLMTSYSIAK